MLPDKEGIDGCTFHSVRGVFQEGGPAFNGAGIKLNSHIQIAVRETKAPTVKNTPSKAAGPKETGTFPFIDTEEFYRIGAVWRAKFKRWPKAKKRAHLGPPKVNSLSLPWTTSSLAPGISRLPEGKPVRFSRHFSSKNPAYGERF